MRERGGLISAEVQAKDEGLDAEIPFKKARPHRSDRKMAGEAPYVLIDPKRRTIHLVSIDGMEVLAIKPVRRGLTGTRPRRIAVEKTSSKALSGSRA
jgi:hypothetical protein